MKRSHLIARAICAALAIFIGVAALITITTHAVTVNNSPVDYTIRDENGEFGHIIEVVIDDCEYIVLYGRGNGITHKSNCNNKDHKTTPNYEKDAHF